MSLAAVKLDDLDWRTMVDAIRRRIAAASRGEWTLHSPVDPGVTLLELYAWLIEQRIYWVDQVPDSMVRAALKLLGVRPATTVAARTLLQVRPAGARQRLAARTQFELDEANPPLRFTTTRAATCLPLAAGADCAAVYATHGGRTRRLDGGAALPLFGTEGNAEVRFDFTLAGPPPMPFAAPFPLLLDLDVAPSLAPAWHPRDARNAPPARGVRWWHSSAAGRRELPLDAVIDGTLGMRRAGVVQLLPDAPWTESAPSIYSLWATVEAGTFVYPPRLWRAVPNAVVAEHRREVRRDNLTLDWLPLPARELALTLDERRSRDGDGPLEGSARVELLERGDQWRAWHATGDLNFHRSDARVFTVDRARHCFEFGDGYQGRVPALAQGSPNARWRAWMGGGPRGNVGRGRNWIAPVAVGAPLEFSATNVVAGVGGRAAESLDEARRRARAAGRRVTRSVTAADYEALATGTPGVDVARARAAIGLHPAHACPMADAVTVFVVPWAPRADGLPEDERVAAPRADEGMLAAVRLRLQRARLIGTQVFVRPVSYRAVRFHIDLAGEPSDAGLVRATLFESLRAFLDPLTGGDGDPATGWVFGAPLRPALLLQRAQRAVDPGHAVRRVAIALDDSADQEDCHDVIIGAHELPYLADLSVALTPLPSAGGLR